MRVATNAPAFDHGAALRVPPLHDARNRRQLLLWLGDDGWPRDGTEIIEVQTPDGLMLARPGDWIILSVTGRFHVAPAGPRIRLVE